MLVFACAFVPILGGGTGARAAAAAIEGQVFDGDGVSLSGVRVVLVHEPAAGLFTASDEKPEPSVVADTRTDEAGFFRLSVPAELPRGGTLEVRVRPTRQWDHLRYAPPAPMRLDDEARRGGTEIVTIVVEDARAWREIEREIRRVGGADTDRGRLLRRLGLPPEVVARADGRIEWRYPDVTYVFQDAELVETRRSSRARRSSSPRGES
jgi:hypothetical protein